MYDFIRGQKYLNIALVLQDEWLTIFTRPANTCTCPLKVYAIKNIRELYVIWLHRVILSKGLVLQDECFGKNYLSFLDFTRDYERKSWIFVPCLCILKGEKKCVPTLPKIFRPVTRNTHFLFGLTQKKVYRKCSKSSYTFLSVLKQNVNYQSWVTNWLFRECSGSVVEGLTGDREATGSSLTGVTVVWSLSKTHLA